MPPHLRHIILNKVRFGVSQILGFDVCMQQTSSSDSLALPIPQPVSLNHLYCTAIKDGMMVLGVTERYKHKFITQVFYSTMPGPNA